jgi:hypothetical protein
VACGTNRSGGEVGLFVGLAVAAYTLPGAVGALALGIRLGHRPGRALVLADSLLRTGFLGTVVVLAAIEALSPVAYVALIAGSSLLTSWGCGTSTRCSLWSEERAR